LDLASRLLYFVEPAQANTSPSILHKDLDLRLVMSLLYIVSKSYALSTPNNIKFLSFETNVYGFVIEFMIEQGCTMCAYRTLRKTGLLGKIVLLDVAATSPAIAKWYCGREKTTIVLFYLSNLQ
jgi:ABC-type uncharacterized transport system permease subunit